MRNILSILCVGALSCLLCVGCDAVSDEQKKQTGGTASSGSDTGAQPASGQENKKPAPAKEGAQSKKTKLGENVFLEIAADGKRRVLVEAKVCLREGMLEHLLCREMTKEHEAILHAAVDAAHIHAALLAAGAEPGNPVRFDPYKPATGTVIKVFVKYKKNGKDVMHPAQHWIRQRQTKKELDYDWVFAGSWLEEDPLDPAKTFYMANAGDVICVANFAASLLDLPVANENDVLDLDFVANTERIPPEGTPVTVILEPVLKK